MTVKEVAEASAPLDFFHGIAQVPRPVADLLAAGSADAEKRHEATRRAWEGARTSLEHVSEAAIGILRFLDIADTGVDRLPGHLESGTTCGAQGIELADRHREVGVVL